MVIIMIEMMMVMMIVMMMLMMMSGRLMRGWRLMLGVVAGGGGVVGVVAIAGVVAASAHAGVGGGRGGGRRCEACHLAWAQPLAASPHLFHRVPSVRSPLPAAYVCVPLEGAWPASRSRTNLRAARHTFPRRFSGPIQTVCQ